MAFWLRLRVKLGGVAKVWSTNGSVLHCELGGWLVRGCAHGVNIAYSVSFGAADWPIICLANNLRIRTARTSALRSFSVSLSAYRVTCKFLNLHRRIALLWAAQPTFCPNIEIEVGHDLNIVSNATDCSIAISAVDIGMSRDCLTGRGSEDKNKRMSRP
jgi:hypothetical protein